jgi:multicomponent Na+:H+ antiporter subunit F
VYYVFLALAVGLVILSVIVFFGRVIPGPSVFDRLTGILVIGTNAIIFLLLLGAMDERLGMYVDMSMAYAAIGFITLLVLGKYFERKGDVDR